MATFEKITQHGRFGNQLFQLAATYAHSKRVGEAAWLRPGFVAYFKKTFPNFDQFFTASSRPTARTHNEGSFQFQPIPAERNLNLFGYFQSERYFAGCKGDLLKMFDLGIKRDPNACALHIRRGDYIKYPKTYPLIGREYYIPAIQRIRQLNPNVQINVFSDDLRAAKLMLDGQNVVYQHGAELEDFKVMVGCTYHIIANSSFSWWAAYLSESENVIAPANWFVKGYADWSDVYTDKMLRI